VLDVVVRHLIVRVDEDLRIAARARERRKATSVRRRTARGLPPEPTPEERMRAGHGVTEDRGEEAEA
jgi:hypothetical protein